MNKTNLDLPTKNTWCPGCGNFGILQAIKNAITNLEKKGVKKENFVLTTGIGCHAKIVDYLNINTFYGLHGRGLATAVGIKIGNPNLKVLTCSGDGDSYDEGISHLIYAAKRNIDLTMMIHDNRNFALTTGQYSATSPKGFKGRSTPQGSPESAFNPLELMLASGATFIARGYTAKIDQLTDLIIQAVEHRGFSFIDILDPCVAWFNTYEDYNKRVYELKDNDLSSKEEAIKRIWEWDYNNGGKIPIGVFYKVQKPIFDEEVNLGVKKIQNIDIKIREILENKI
jgi:2-oxoglutarate ferredoxin oxidoreductase subunit beta